MSGISPIVAVGGVVLAPGPSVLLVKRGSAPLAGRWSLPGGRVHGGESLSGAVGREILEETGVSVAVGDLVEVVELIAEGFHYVVLDYRCSPLDPKQVPMPGDDAAAARYVHLSELTSLDPTDDVMRVINKALAMQPRREADTAPRDERGVGRCP